MRIAITGSTGFIGSHLVKHFFDKDIVLPIERKLLYDFAALRSWAYHNRPEYIIHTAAAGNMHDKSMNIEILGANTMPIFHLLELARIIRFKRIINFSSSSVLLPHQTVYSATKRAGEALCEAYANEYHTPVVSIRPYSVYGPGEADFRFIPTVFRSCLTGEPMQLDPTATHDWIYISDVVKVIAEIIAPNSQAAPILIGTGYGTTNAAVITEIEKLTGQKANITKTTKLRSFDNRDWVSLSPTPHALNLSEGLALTYDYYKKKYA